MSVKLVSAGGVAAPPNPAGVVHANSQDLLTLLRCHVDDMGDAQCISAHESIDVLGTLPPGLSHGDPDKLPFFRGRNSFKSPCNNVETYMMEELKMSRSQRGSSNVMHDAQHPTTRRTPLGVRYCL